MFRGHCSSDLGRQGFPVESCPRLLHFGYYRQAFSPVRTGDAERCTTASAELIGHARWAGARKPDEPGEESGGCRQDLVF